MIKGKQSIQFDQAPYILEAASVAGKKEADGPLGKQFDKIEMDPPLQLVLPFGCGTRCSPAPVYR